MSREHWKSYLVNTPAYGTFEDRCPEYSFVTQALRSLGLTDDDLIIDVGAGTCDMDHFLRTRGLWRGQYFPVDGAVQGVDLDDKKIDLSAVTGIAPGEADFVIAIETIEHTHNPAAFLAALEALEPRKGIVITTPNADVCDVESLDATHYVGLKPKWFRDKGYLVDLTEFNGRGNPDKGWDTIRAQRDTSAVLTKDDTQD